MKIKLLIGLVFVTTNLFSQASSTDSAKKAIATNTSTGKSPSSPIAPKKDSAKPSQSFASLIGGRWIWKAAIIIEQCDFRGNPYIEVKKGNDTEHLYVYGVSHIGQKFSVIGFNKDSSMAIIKIVPYRGILLKHDFNKKYGLSKDPNVKDTSWLVSSKNIEQFAAKDTSKIYTASLAIGVVNFPFKFRPQKNRMDFSGAFNFGVAAGYTIRHRSSNGATFTLLTGYSISNLNLDAVSVTSNSQTLTSTNNYTAFSISFGVMVQYNKVQVGVFIGWDQLSRINDDEFGWKYQGKPWLSIGIGLAIFSTQSNTTTSTTQSNP